MTCRKLCWSVRNFTALSKFFPSRSLRIWRHVAVATWDMVPHSSSKWDAYDAWQADGTDGQMYFTLNGAYLALSEGLKDLGDVGGEAHVDQHHLRELHEGRDKSEFKIFFFCRVWFVVLCHNLNSSCCYPTLIRLVSLVSGEATFGKEPPSQDENHEDDLLQNPRPLLGFHRDLKFSHSRISTKCRVFESSKS